jgi:hypothetical protein
MAKKVTKKVTKKKVTKSNPVDNMVNNPNAAMLILNKQMANSGAIKKLSKKK